MQTATMVMTIEVAKVMCSSTKYMCVCLKCLASGGLSAIPVMCYTSADSVTSTCYKYMLPVYVTSTYVKRDTFVGYTCKAHAHVSTVANQRAANVRRGSVVQHSKGCKSLTLQGFHRPTVHKP